MSRRMAACLVVLGVLLAGFCGASAAAPTVGDVVGQVSLTTYQDFLANRLYAGDGDNRGFTTSGTSRQPTADHDPARDYIYNYLDGLGLSTALDPFSFTKSGNTYAGCNNVVAVKPGTTRPGDVYILGAHYDSAENPGADDNASGVAGVLEAARVLSQYQFEATLVFIAFDAEEKGLCGSDHYAAAHIADDILGMVSLDMIAYNPAGANHDKVNVYGREASDPIKQALAAAVTAYGNGVTAVIGGDQPFSDQAPFEARGFDACLLIEYAWQSNARYHQPTDSVDQTGYIDYQYAVDLTRSAVGYAAASAVVMPEPATMLLLGFGTLLVLVRRRARAA